MSKTPIPGVFTNITQNPIIPSVDIKAIKDLIQIQSGDIMDFNSYMNIAQAVAKHYNLDDFEKRLERFYELFAGCAISIQTMIVFWATVFGVVDQ